MEQQVSSEQMNSLNALANTNIEISKAKEVLFKMKEEETEYLKKREKKAIQKIQKIIDESASLLQGARDNYYETTQFYNTVSAFSASLVHSYAIFKEIITDFDEKNELWEVSIKKQLDFIAEEKKKISEDKTRIENDKKGIEKSFILIENDKKLIESRQSQMSAALKIIKNKQNG